MTRGRKAPEAEKDVFVFRGMQRTVKDLPREHFLGDPEPPLALRHGHQGRGGRRGEGL